MNKESLLYYFFLIFLCVGVLVMNICTPLYSDDFHYKYIFEPDFLMQKPIESISDIIQSQFVHYFNFNGRFVPHFFVQLFDGLLGKRSFDICNALIFGLFLHMLNVVCCRKGFYLRGLLVSVSCLFFLFISFKHTILWMSGACNYLWTSTFLLIFHFFLVRIDASKWVSPLFFIYAIFVGWTHEGFMLPACCGYLVYFLRHRAEISAHKWVMLIGLFIGTALVCFAPGTLKRADAEVLATESLYDWTSILKLSIIL